jgi:hypothetical protein
MIIQYNCMICILNIYRALDHGQVRLKVLYKRTFDKIKLCDLPIVQYKCIFG